MRAPDLPSTATAHARRVRLDGLMARTAGSAAVPVGLIDGPVLTGHAGLAAEGMRAVSAGAWCGRAESAACAHGTFVAGLLHGRPDGPAPGLCPACPLLVRPIFAERARGGVMPSCEPEELAAAVGECVAAGARVLNLSVGVLWAGAGATRALGAALDAARRADVLVVAAAGNQGAVGGSALTGHPAVLPVVAVNAAGRVTGFSNLGTAIGRRGLAAPGDDVVGLAPGGGTRAMSGTSAATAFVTAAAALLWSLRPSAPAAEVRAALAGSPRARTSIVPPVLDAEAAWAAFAAGRAAA